MDTRRAATPSMSHPTRGALSHTPGAVCGDARPVGGTGAARRWVTGDDEFGRHTWFRHQLRERGQRYVLGGPCTTTMRDLEAPPPAYQGRGCRPKAPWQSVTDWRTSLPPTAWRPLP